MLVPCAAAEDHCCREVPWGTVTVAVHDGRLITTGVSVTVIRDDWVRQAMRNAMTRSANSLARVALFEICSLGL